MTSGQNLDDSRHDSASGTSPATSNVEIELAAAKQQIEVLEGKLISALEELARHASTENERVRLEVELQSLRASTSWRVTAPMRRLSAMARALRLALGTIQR